MKKALFSSLLFLVAVSVVVSAIQTDKEIPGYGVITADYSQKSVQIMRGWNLIQSFPNPDWILTGDLESNVRAIYGFDPLKQRYVRFYPNPEFSANPGKGQISNTEVEVSYIAQNTAFWVYFDIPESSAQKIDYTTFTQQTGKKQMVKGWNFVGISQVMISKKFDEFKGDCAIEKLYWWQPRDQEFVNVLSDKERMEILRYPENIGTGLIVKVAQNCALLGPAGSSNIPVAPSIPDIKECTDSDGGTVIDVKGTASNSEKSSQDVCSTSNNKMIVEYDCDGKTGNVINYEFDCSERGFLTCSDGRCIK